MAIATPWRRINDSMAIRPVQFFIPYPATQVESTGLMEDRLPQVEEGNALNNSADERKTSSDKVETDVNHEVYLNEDAENDSLFQRN